MSLRSKIVSCSNPTNLPVNAEVVSEMLTVIWDLQDALSRSQRRLEEAAPGRIGEIDRLKEFADWVETWVSNPVGAYSVHALDGLFGMTRDKLAALRTSRVPSPDRS